MRTIWHIVSKDLRSVRVGVALLLGVLVLKTGLLVGASRSYLGEREPLPMNGLAAAYEVSAMYAIEGRPLSETDRHPDGVVFVVFSSHVLLAILWLADLPVLWMTLLRILQEDVGVSARAFWRTRPVSPGQMAAAKGASLVLLGLVVPGAFQLIASELAWPGQPPWRALLHNWTAQGAWLAAVVTLAALWRNPLVGLLGIGAVAFGLLPSIFHFYPEYFGQWPPDKQRLMHALRWAAYGCALATAVGMLAASYCQRRRAVNFGILAGGLAAIVLLSKVCKEIAPAYSQLFIR